MAATPWHAIAGRNISDRRVYTVIITPGDVKSEQ